MLTSTLAFSSYPWDFSVVVANWRALLRGLGVTLEISLYAITLGTLAGAAIAYAKGSVNPAVRVLANAFTDRFRAIPVLVMMVWLFYCFPSIMLLLGFESPIRLESRTVSVLALAIYLAAQLADILRAGLDSIPSNQYEIARALGIGESRIIRHIQIPQVILLTLPAVLGQYASTLLLSSLASVIAAAELLHAAQNIITNQYHTLEVYTTVALLYLAIAWPLTWAAKRIGKRSGTSQQNEELAPVKLIVGPHTLIPTLEVVGAGVKSESGAQILEDIHFRINPGDVVGVFGRSGAGKSTLIRLLVHSLEPTTGQVRWFSPSGSECSKLCFGYVPQGLALWPHLSALENVALALWTNQGKSRAEARSEAQYWLQQLGLEQRSKAKPGFLSGGEAQRVAIARALAIRPAIFLLDEITSSLDPELISQVVEILTAIAKSGASVVLVGHDYRYVYNLINKALFLELGRLVDFGEKGAVFEGRVPQVGNFLSHYAKWDCLPQLQATPPRLPVE